MEARRSRLMLAVAASLAFASGLSAQGTRDLSVSKIEFCDVEGTCSPDMFGERQTFVRVHVDNVSHTNASSPFVVVLEIDPDIKLQTSRQPAMPVAESRAFTFSVGRLPAGAHRVTAFTDSQHADAESASGTADLRVYTTIFRSGPPEGGPSQGNQSAANQSAANHAATNHAATNHAATNYAAVNQALVSQSQQVSRVPLTLESIVTPSAPAAAAESGVVAAPAPEISSRDIPVPAEIAGGAMVPGLLDAPQPAGKISGRITTASGAPLAGAGVTIYDEYGRLVDARTTGASGEYVSGDLPPGRYQVAALRNAGWQDTLVRDMPITKYGRVRLRHGESLHAAIGAPAPAADGDFYLAFFNGRPQFWSNHDRQRGVMALGDIRSTPLEAILPPSAECEAVNIWTTIAPTSCYSRGAVEAARRHAYAALPQRGAAGSAIVFRVLDVQPSLWVDVEYLVGAGSSRAQLIEVVEGATTPAIDQSLAPAPFIASVLPPRGTAGTEVTITGVNFHDNAIVLFGDVPAGDVRVVSPSSIVAVVPANAPGSVTVDVWNGDGSTASAANAFRYDATAPGAFAKHATSVDAPFTEPFVTLEWQASQNAVAYEVCVDSVDDHQCTESASITSGWAIVGDVQSATLMRALLRPDVPYFWQVRGVSAGGIIEADEGSWSSFSVASVAIAQLLNPIPGSTLSASETTFEWTPGIHVRAYRIAIGSAPGADDLCSLVTTSLSAAVALPYDGRTLYVRLSSLIDGQWLSRDYALQAALLRIPGLGLGEGGPNPPNR